MSKRFVSASLTAAALTWAAGSLATAKPPDLPADTRETCEAERDIQGLPVSNDPSPELNTSRPSAPAVHLPSVDPVKQEHARRMYLIGERCRKKGDLDMAQNCYEEARRLCPESHYAEKAVAKLRQIKTAGAGETSRGSTEEADYSITLELPQNINMPISRLESEAALKERMKLEAARYGVPIASPEEETQAKQRFEEERQLALQKQHTEARILYLIGERCREGGDKAMARRCYEEAVRLGAKCAYGRKAVERLRGLDANQGGSEASEPMEEPVPPQKKHSRRSKRIKDWLLQIQGEPRSLAVDLPAVDHLVVHDFDRLLAETEEQSASLMIVPEDAPTAGDEEEQEYPLMPCGGLSTPTQPITLFVDPAPRDLVVRVQTAETGELLLGGSADLSDWLRATIRSLDGVGSLKIDAARLGRLLAEGEGAVRALGCALVEEAAGKRYVVYPDRR